MNNTKPILFSTPMVQAILKGQKTQTRRPIKLKMVPPGANFTAASIQKDGSGSGWVAWMTQNVSAEETARLYPGEQGFKCPYGSVGDVLWVRETWQKVSLSGSHYSYLYKSNPQHQAMTWKPSIHMPKEACQLFLRITDIRVERLNDISDVDALAEGIRRMPLPNCLYENYDTKSTSFKYMVPKLSFQSLWESINGKGSWDINPWIWVVNFERCDKPENF